MQETLEFHGRPPVRLPSLLPKILLQKTSATEHTENTKRQIDRINWTYKSLGTANSIDNVVANAVDRSPRCS
jgi:hypothetical protein